MCAFDDQDRALAWNRHFLKFFPEHDGHIHEGESYRENLYRFYSSRLDAQELVKIDEYVDAGIERHRTQAAPYEFEHRGRRIRVSSLPLGPQGRVRIWRSDDARSANRVSADPLEDGERRVVGPLSPEALLDCVPDGLMLCSADGNIQWVNDSFGALYGIPDTRAIIGAPFEAIYVGSWQGEATEGAGGLAEGLTLLRENLRFTGAAFELPLPRDRWCRVVARAGSVGTTLFTHSDITARRRAEREIAKAREAEKLIALQEERERLLADMHDGLGSQLAIARLRAERGTMSQEQMVDALVAMLADLHLVVDTLRDPEGSLANALVDFRLRCDRRLASTNARLDWDISLAHAPQLPPTTRLHVLRIVQEALTNALRHGHGGHVNISASFEPGDGFVIAVRDKGVDLPAEIVPGRGLYNMKRRAREIGAELTIANRVPPPGVEVVLRLPPADVSSSQRSASA